MNDRLTSNVLLILGVLSAMLTPLINQLPNNTTYDEWEHILLSALFAGLGVAIKGIQAMQAREATANAQERRR